MKKLISIILVIFCTINLAKSQDWVWANQGASVGASLSVRGSTIDASGNTYILGQYTGTTVIGTQTLNSYGSGDIFLAKYNSSGVFQWAVRAGSTGNEDPFGIDVDASSNVYITGGFNLTATFGEGAFNPVSSGGQDVFLAKYNSNGICQWAYNVGSGPLGQRAYDIVVDNNELIITGFLAGDMTIPGLPVITFTAARSYFIAKFDNNGNAIWAHKYTSTSSSTNLLTIAKHDGVGYYIGGTLFGSMTFDNTVPGPATTITNIEGSGNILLFKVDLNGDYLWSTNAGSPGDDQTKDIITDASGNVYSTGYIQGDVNVGGGVTLTNNGSIDYFISKRNSSGTIQWAVNGGSTGVDISNSIFVFNNYIYVFGYFTGTVNIGTDQLVSAGNYDPFVAVYDNSGLTINAQNILGSGAFNDEGKTIVLDSKGNSYVSGYFASPTLTANTTVLTNADANPDLFLAKYSWISSKTSSDVSCKGGADGTATVTPIGGTGPYNFLWDDPLAQNTQTATGLSAGTYNVTITDADLTQSINSITISESPTALSLSSVITHPTCALNNEGAVDLTISGGTAPYNPITWSNLEITEDIIGLSAGNYTVSVTDTFGVQVILLHV